jgi:hypothetical protein
MLCAASKMSEWKNEDDIKAELRAMTDELRQLREGLRNMVSPPKSSPAGAFLRRQSWPPTVEHPPPVAADRQERPITSRKNKTSKSKKPR